MGLESLDICQAAKLLESGQISCVDLVNACLARIGEFDSEVEAWAWLDRDYALRQAEELDSVRQRGKPIGRLHGIPIGLKDIIDTAIIPTEYGSEMFKGRLPKNDATLVDRLRQQGAIMMGKTVTCAFATFMPGKTKNPHNIEHTPGGSSSGSAAAVASFMVPAAVGTQTNGSVIRPASFCGTVGYKPSFGLIPRTGVMRQSGFLDQVGVFARSVEDAALLAEAMIGPDNQDHDCVVQYAPPALQKICQQEPPLVPKFGLVKTTAWDNVDQSTRSGFDEIVEVLGDQIEEVTLSPSFDQVWDMLKTVNEAEMAASFAPIYEKGKAYLDNVVTTQIECGQKITAVEYLNATQHRELLNNILEEVFSDYDALITPAACGEAPFGLATTGDPSLCTTWTFCGVPSITLPMLQGGNGLPVGVQVVGGYLDDGRLLRSARWLYQYITQNL